MTVLTMEKCSEDDVNWSKTCRLKTAFREIGKLCNDIDVDGIVVLREISRPV